MRHAPRLATLCVLALTVAACGGAANGPAPDTSPGEDTALDTTTEPETEPALVLGAVASLTGSGADYGTGQTRGIELGVEHALAEHDQLALETVDDRSTVEGGVEAFEDLIESRASVILGPTLSPVAAGAGPIAQSVGVPVLAVTNTTLDIDEIGDMIWRVSLSEERMLPQTVQVASETHDIETAALVWDGSDDYSIGAARAFRSAAEDYGVELVADVRFNSEDWNGADHSTGGASADADDAGMDAATGYANAVDSAADEEPDALFLAARSRPAAGLLLAAEELGVDLPLVGGNGFNAPEVIAEAGSAAEGLMVAASWNPEIDQTHSLAFVDEYTERFGEEPDAFAAQSYAGVQIVSAAIAETGAHSRHDIQEGLGRISELDTVLGTISFEGHEAVYPAAIQQVTDGHLELIARGAP